MDGIRSLSVAVSRKENKYPVDDQIHVKHGGQLAESSLELDGSVAAMPPQLPKRSSSSRDAVNHARNRNNSSQTAVVGTFDGIQPDQRGLRVPAQPGIADQSGARLSAVADFPTELVYEGRSTAIARPASSTTSQQQSRREPKTAFEKLKGNQQRFAQYVLASIEAGTPPSDAFDARQSRWHVPTMWQQVQRRRRTEAQLQFLEQRAAAYMAGETEDSSRYTQSLEENASLESGVPMISPSERLALREDIIQTRKELLDRRVRSVNSVLSLVRRGTPVDDSVVCYGRGGMHQMPESVSDRTRQLLQAHAEAGTFQARLLSHDKEYAPGSEDDAAVGGTSTPSIGDRIQASTRLSWDAPARARSRSTGSLSVVSQEKLMRLRQIVRRKHSESLNSYSPDGGSMYEVDDATGEAMRGAGAAGELVHPHAKLLAVAAASRGSAPAPGGGGGGGGGQLSQGARNQSQYHWQSAGGERLHDPRGKTGSNKRNSASLMLEGLVDSPVPSTATAVAGDAQSRHGAWRHRRPARRRVGAVSSADAFLSGTSAVPEYGYKRARASSRMELDVHELRQIRDSLRRRVGENQQRLMRREFEDKNQPGQTNTVSSDQDHSTGSAQSASPLPVMYPLARIKLPTASPLAVKWGPDRTKSPLQLPLEKQIRELVHGQSLQGASRDERAQRIASLVKDHVLAQLRQPSRSAAGRNELRQGATQQPSDPAAQAAKSSEGSVHQISGGVGVASPLTRPPSDPRSSTLLEAARPEGPIASKSDQEAIASPLERPREALYASPKRVRYHTGKSMEPDGGVSCAVGRLSEAQDTSEGQTSPGSIEPTSPIQRHSQRGIGVDAVIHAISSSRHPPEIPGGISAMAAQLGVIPAPRGRGGPAMKSRDDGAATTDAAKAPVLQQQAQLRAVLQEALPEVFEMRRELAEARLEIHRLKAQQGRNGQNRARSGGTGAPYGSTAGLWPQRTPPKPVGNAPTFRSSLGDGLEVASVPMHLGAVSMDKSASTLGNTRYPHGRRRELKDTKIHRVHPAQPAQTPEGLVLHTASATNDSQGEASLVGETGSLALSSAKPPTPPAYDLDLERTAAAAEGQVSTGRASLGAHDSREASTQHVGNPISHRGPGFMESVS